MPLLRVIDRDGVEHQVEAKTGLKVMETLRDLEYGGGGDLRRHVLLRHLSCLRGSGMGSESCRPRCPMSANCWPICPTGEPNSRLSCQIEFTEALAGLRVTVAPDE